MKAPIQTAAADAILQIAVFEPGRALLEASSAMMEALRALATGGGALTKDGRQSAQLALVAIEGVATDRTPVMRYARIVNVGKSQSCMIYNPCMVSNRTPVARGGSDGDGGGHVMLSYQWDVQDRVRRIVDELRSRGYTTWFVSRMPLFILSVFVRALFQNGKCAH